MGKKVSVIVALLTILMFNQIKDAQAAKHPGEKFARGTINAWNAQYELSDNVHDSMYYHGPLGFFIGFAKGTGAFAVRSMGAAYDMLFFWFPFPKDNKPVVNPELNF